MGIGESAQCIRRALPLAESAPQSRARQRRLGASGIRLGGDGVGQSRLAVFTAGIQDLSAKLRQSGPGRGVFEVAQRLRCDLERELGPFCLVQQSGERLPGPCLTSNRVP